MEVSIEILAGAVAIGLGLVRIVETLVVKSFTLLTGKKTPLSEIKDNHLHTIEEAVVKSNYQHEEQIKQGERMINQHEKTIELLAELRGKIK